MGNIGIFQLLVVAMIIILLFGTKRLRHFGSDLGHAIKGFRRSVQDSTDEIKRVNHSDEKGS